MIIHPWLMQKFSWYRRWHEYKYCQLVHTAVFLVFLSGEIYLLLQLQQSILLVNDYLSQL